MAKLKAGFNEIACSTTVVESRPVQEMIDFPLLLALKAESEVESHEA